MSATIHIVANTGADRDLVPRLLEAALGESESQPALDNLRAMWRLGELSVGRPL